MDDTRIESKMPLKPPGGGHTRINHIDSLKGFAILCVVLGHVADGYLDGNTYPEANQFLFYIFNAVYAFHMALFMMISGYVYAVAYFDEKGRPEHRRIYGQIGDMVGVYLLFSVLFGLVKVVLSQYTNKPVAITDILLIWGKPISPYWYLYDLVLLYLVFSVPALCSADRRLVTCVLALAAFFSRCVSTSWFQISSVLYYAVFFYIGASNRRYSDWLVGNRRIVFGMFAISVVLCAVFWDWGPYTIRSEAVSLNSVPVANAFIAAGISLMLWYLFRNVKCLSENRFLAVLGRRSLEIYVIHCFFTAGFRAVLPRIGVSNAYISMVLNFALSTFIPLVIAFICNWLGIHEFIFKPVSFTNEWKNRRL